MLIIALGLATALLAVGCGGSATTDSSGGAGGSGGPGGGAGTGGFAGSAGSGGATGGSAGAAGSAGAGGTAGAAGTAGSGGGCEPGCETEGFKCCGSTCTNPNNDILNCGSCGNTCTGPNPFCDGGTCGAAPCAGTACTAPEHCCQDACCGENELCCVVPGPVSMAAQCTTPTGEGTCPRGCLTCVCASPDTPIATPEGERPIASLREGDLVLTLEGCEVVAAPLLRVNRAAVQHHAVVRVVLASERVLEISGGHPTSDGRLFRDLTAGDQLGGVQVLSVETIAYGHDFTFDILPESDSGLYFAGGVLIGSTLAPHRSTRLGCANASWSVP